MPTQHGVDRRDQRIRGHRASDTRERAPCSDAKPALALRERWDHDKRGATAQRPRRRCYSLDVPARKVTACTFGGARLDELYITTSREGLAAGEDPFAGTLFRTEPGVAGQPVKEFAG